MSVRVAGLTKHFASAEIPAVSEVSFVGPKGAVTTLLGPSGAGKSTILRLIAGLERPEAGRVEIDGEDCTDRPVQERNIGFVFQNYALFPSMTVKENVAFSLSVRRRSREEIGARVRELLELVQLSDYGDRLPAQLSGGQRQRIALARALANRPRVLLLDEPFGALDARVRHELRQWLERLHDETGVTTLLVTHDQVEALELSQHVVIMRHGRVVQAGSPHEIYDHPANAFVASFMGGANVLDVDGPSGVPAKARAFVRPHDVKLAFPGGAPGRVAAARIARLKRIGGYVRVSLALAGGDEVSMELPHAEVESLRLAEGHQVLVDLGAARLLLEDYAI